MNFSESPLTLKSEPEIGEIKIEQLKKIRVKALPFFTI